MNGKVGTRCAILGLAVASLVSVSGSAEAAPYDQVECTNSGNASGYSIFCILTVSNGASNQAWTYNGYAVPSAAGSNWMRHGCGPEGAPYTVAVTYLDNSGVTSTVSTTNACGGINP